MSSRTPGWELGGCQRGTLPPQIFRVTSCHWSRSLSESPTQTIDSSPCCKTGPSSGPPKWKCLAPPLLYAYAYTWGVTWVCTLLLCVCYLDGALHLQCVCMHAFSEKRVLKTATANALDGSEDDQLWNDSSDNEGDKLKRACHYHGMLMRTY